MSFINPSDSVGPVIHLVQMIPTTPFPYNPIGPNRSNISNLLECWNHHLTSMNSNYSDSTSHSNIGNLANLSSPLKHANRSKNPNI